MQRKLIFFHGLLLLLQLVSVFEMALTLTLSPTIVEYFSVGKGNFGLLTLGYLFFGFLSPFMGRVSGRIGLKKTFVLLCFTALSGSLAVAISPTALLYTLFRSLLGLSYFSLLGLLPSVVISYSPANQVGKVSGIYKIVFALSIFMAPFTGVILLNRVGFTGIYLILAGLFLFLMLLFLALPFQDLPIKKREEEKGTSDKKRVTPFLISALLFPVPIALFSTYLGLYLTGRGLTQQSVGYVYSLMGSGSIVAGIVILFLSDRWGKYPMALAGLLLVALALTGVLLPPLALIIISGFLFYLGFDLFTGMFFPTVGMKFPHNSGFILTQLTSANSLGMLLSTFLAPLIFSQGFTWNIVVSLACTILCFLFYRRGMGKD